MDIFEATFEAVIFDNDGTLTDSTPAVERSWLRWAEEHDIAVTRLLGQHGKPARAIVDELVPAERAEAAYRRVHDIEMADLDDVVALPGAVEALAALRGHGVAIATSATRSLAEARIAAAGLEAPDVLVTIDDVERGKPHPDPFLLAARRLGADPARCLVVEDAPAGLAAARAAGCASLAVVTTNPREELRADAVVADLGEVEFAAGAAGNTVRRRA